MIPQSDIVLLNEDMEETPQPSLTYKLDLSRGRIGGVAVDGLEAVKQAVFKMLSTIRFEHLIYSDAYGNEADVGAVSGRAVFEAEVERWVKEALRPDDRIASATQFRFSYEGDTALVQFVVESDYGNYTDALEVSSNV
ncbi:hypothetical protein R70723_06750 [Paenibacillus sp. FSL R7-0273]|uniref:DUF2634 domain-containing protein n=1 Tax=Paenibacillus sp. FSL R7-0273 TaxID=1536772 RepID=UPI0004F8BA47|nr:DUF2634 domain-containing protein [Paenibacillus sp. FSL R7-0273]AIQ45626.1 hypothetical protein R70723_06750 [Paenibacillus sp. FSL R7-0273]OMF95146.1 hypothetical protein BK144_06310 [Paenibacillus sp. FSL R7-0273]